MAENRKVNIRVTSNVDKVLKGAGDESQKAGNKSAGVLGRIKGLMSGIGTAASGATAGVRAFTTALISSGVGAIVVAMGSLVALFSKTITVSADFEKALSGLQAITGATNEEISALSENAKALGASTAFTASQVVELQTEFSKLGFSTSEILNATEATLALAASANTDLANAAVVAGNTLRGFGLDAEETSRVTDVMAKSFTSSALNIFKFQESMKLVAPIAATAKVSLEQATAALSVLADRGVAGSIAGTQLRRVMSDLAQKTGKDFQTSLEITADRLSKATSTADKLAIAKELVGDRAKGSLIALAENRDTVIELTKAYENAGGAAQEMAEKQLDNLRGDVTKLKSAFEGFMLSLEDGEGLMNKLARGGVQLLTNTLTGLREGVQFLGVAFPTELERIKTKASLNLDLVSNAFKKMGVQISQVANNIKLTLADVPIIGAAFNKSELQARREELVGEYQLLANETSNIFEAKGDADAKAAASYAEFRVKQAARIAEDGKRAVKSILETDEFQEGSSDGDEEKSISKREAFLAKLKKIEEDFEDKTELQKIERKRKRHLAELETLKLNETEKEEAKKRINDYYNALSDAQIAKNKIKKEAADAKELETLKSTTIEKLDLDNNLKIARIQNSEDILNAAIGIAGEESKLAKVLFALKQALALKELIMTAKNSAKKAAITAAESGAEVAKGAAKAGATLNPFVIAAYAATAVGIVASIASAFKKTKDAVAQAGAVSVPSINTSSSAQSSQPNFNVIGQTDANANLIASSIARNQQTPLRAYVVSGDVSSEQELDNKTKSQASLG